MYFKYFMLLAYSGIFFVKGVVSEIKVFEQCGRTKFFRATITYDDWYGPKKYSATINGCLQDDNVTTIVLSTPLAAFEPETFINLPFLSKIDMTDSNVQLLNEEFFINTPKLRYIFAGYNRMTIVRNYIFKNLILTRLHLNSNLINSIQDGAFENLKVQAIDLSYNHLSEIKETWFDNTVIEELHLQYNKIVALKKNAFQKIKNMTFINLNYNGMLYIEAETFVGQDNLLKLQLAGNALREINFINDVRLDLLDVGFNRLSDVAIDRTTRIREILVYPNPWDCDRLRTFWKQAFRRRIAFGNSNTQLREWDEEYPICVVKQDCNEEHCQNELYKSYFKIVNYISYGAYNRIDLPPKMIRFPPL